MHPDDKVLSLGDVLLRRSDVDLLTGPYWLNDQIVSFYFEYLQQNGGIGDDTILLPGSTVFLLLHGSADDAKQQAEALHLAEKALILFAVNDNPFVDEANGGTHWTLLAYTRTDHTFRHYDSGHGGGSSSSKDVAARGIAAKLAPALGTDYSFEAPRVPQQCNGYDCGMHLLSTAAVLCKAMRDCNTIASAKVQSQLQQHSSPAAAAKLRVDLLAMVSTSCGQAEG